MEKERTLQFNLEKLTPENGEAVVQMRNQSWRDTYPNQEFGVTNEWLEARFVRSTPEQRAVRMREILDNPHLTGWVAMDREGNVIGETTLYIDDGGTQHIGSLYVAKAWHGMGIGAALMEQTLNWFDAAKPIELSVATYSERAKAFYRKWDFEEIPGSEELYAGKIPVVTMIRKGYDS